MNRKMKDLHLRIAMELYEKLKQIADKEDRTVAYLIRRIIKEYLEKGGKTA